MALEDFDGAGSDDGDGRGVVGWEIPDGVKEDEAREVGESARHFIGLR